MIGWFSLLTLSLIGATPDQQAGQPANGWYGIDIGDLPPPDHRTGEAWSWPDEQPPAPWTEGMVWPDSDGRAAEIELSDSEAILLDVPPSPPGYVRPRTPIAELRARIAAGVAVRAYAIARLGPPSKVMDFPSKRGLREVALRWDFIDRFVRCEANVPIFKAATIEPSGLIASVELEYGPSAIKLRILGKRAADAASDAKSEQERATDACAPKSVEPNAAEEVGHGIQQFCEENPDRCVSPVPGVLVIPAPGVTLVPIPCPKKSKATQCFKGAEVGKGKDGKSFDQPTTPAAKQPTS